MRGAIPDGVSPLTPADYAKFLLGENNHVDTDAYIRAVAPLMDELVTQMADLRLGGPGFEVGVVTGISMSVPHPWAEGIETALQRIGVPLLRVEVVP